MGKRVLLITQYFLPEITAASFRLNDLYNALKLEGFEVTVITANPHRSATKKPKATKNIHRLNLSDVTKKSFLSYIRNYFGFMFKSIIFTLFKLRNKKYDYVIVTSPPLFVAFGGFVISFFKRAKLIVDIRDIWPDSAVAAGMLKKDGFLYRITKILERFLYKKSNIITCVSKPMKEYIYKESGHRNIQVLYNGISPSVKLSNKLVKNKLGKNGKIRVGYAGNIGIVQNIEVLVATSLSLSQKGFGKFFEFVIIGDGVERENLEDKVEKYNITNIKFLGSKPKSDVVNLLDRMDVLFFSLIENQTFDKTIPSKLFDYLLHNKPIITSIKGEGRNILKELGCGLFFDSNNSDSLVDKLMKYKDNRSLYEEASRKNQQYVLKNFNREKTFRDFLKGI